jgi:hypothetical protein
LGSCAICPSEVALDLGCLNAVETGTVLFDAYYVTASYAKH